MGCSLPSHEAICGATKPVEVPGEQARTSPVSAVLDVELALMFNISRVLFPEGSIPNELANLISLETLNLRNNYLTGEWNGGPDRWIRVPHATDVGWNAGMFSKVLVAAKFRKVLVVVYVVTIDIRGGHFTPCRRHR